MKNFVIFKILTVLIIMLSVLSFTDAENQGVSTQMSCEVPEDCEPGPGL